MAFSIYNLGNSNGPVPADPLVASTSMRWGNYDTVTTACGHVGAEIRPTPDGPPSAPALRKYLLESIRIPIRCRQSAIPGRDKALCLPSFYLSSKPSLVWLHSVACHWPGRQRRNCGRMRRSAQHPGTLFRIARHEQFAVQGNVSSNWLGGPCKCHPRNELRIERYGHAARWNRRAVAIQRGKLLFGSSAPKGPQHRRISKR